MLRTPEPKEQARLLTKLLSTEGFVLPYQKALDFVAQLQGHRSWQVMQTMPVIAPQAVAEVNVPEFTVHGFNVADVRSVRPDLTNAQALRVLGIADESYDANDGLTWDILQDHANEFPEYCIDAVYKDPGVHVSVTVNLANGSIYYGSTNEVREAGWTNRKCMQDAWRGLRLEEAKVTLADGTVCELEGYPEVFDGFSEELVTLVDKLRVLEESTGKSLLRTLHD